MVVYQRIVVTGSNGFVGTHLCAALAAAYPTAELFSLARSDARTLPGWRPLEADLTDAAAVDAAIASAAPDLVVHLAAQSSPLRAARGAEETWRVNLVGTLNLGAAVRAHTPEATMLFASSAAVYGASLRDGPVGEDTPPRPLDAYSRSKLAAEMALLDVVPTTGRLIIARPVNHSGAGQAGTDFVLSSFAAQIAAIEAGLRPPRMTVGDLSKARDFLDVRDVVAAYMAMIADADRLPGHFGLFNIASGKANRLSDLLDGLRRKIDTPVDVFVDPGLIRPSATDVPVAVATSEPLRRLFGWEPRWSTDDMLTSLLDFWREMQQSPPSSQPHVE